MTLLESVLKFPSREGTAVRFYDNGELRSYSWPEYFNEVKKVTAALRAYGVKKQTKVAVKSPTSLKWGLLDLGIQCLGAVTVPIYPNSTPEEIEYILKDSEASLLFVSGPLSFEANVDKVIQMEESDWDEFLNSGSGWDSDDVWFENLPVPEQSSLATLIYTSGTTGVPKGVCLSSIQIHSEITEAFSWGISKNDTTLCFLPFAHVLGRVEFWAHVYWGYTLGFAESLEKLRENLKEIKPTVFIAVPRVFEKFYDAVLSQMEGMGLKRKLFDWAMNVGKEVSFYKLSRRKVPLETALKFEMAERLVFSKIQSAFGGRLRFAISGGAPLALDIAQFFHHCGILILEGYGLTETTAAVAVNRPSQFVFGTVGTPVGDVKVKIADDGEILIKSKKVMMGYHKLPEETEKVLKDGWFYTGDIGEILPTGEIRITDRKKDLIKTSGGKYVAPQKLEGFLKEHPFISQVLVFGDQKKYITALLQLNQETTKKVPRQDVEEQIRNHVAEVNARLSSYETIKKFSLVEDEWTIENGLLTPSLKLKRKALIGKYKDLLESLY